MRLSWPPGCSETENVYEYENVFWDNKSVWKKPDDLELATNLLQPQCSSLKWDFYLILPSDFC